MTTPALKQAAAAAAPALQRRKRGVTAAPTPKLEATPEMERLAVECHLENQAALAHGNKAKKAREALYKAMKGIGLKAFQTTTTTAAGALTLNSELKTSAREVIDIELLQKNTTPEQFLACVSATKGDVESNVGTAIAALCAVEKTGNENVTVKPAK